MFQFLSKLWMPFGSTSRASCSTATSTTESVNNKAPKETATPTLPYRSSRNSSSLNSDRVERRQAKRENNAGEGEESAKKRIQRWSSQAANSSNRYVGGRSSATTNYARSIEVDRSSSGNGATGTLSENSSSLSRVSKVGTWYVAKANLTPEPDGNAKKNLLNSIFRDRAFTVVAPKTAYKLGSRRPVEADVDFVFDDKYHTLVSFKSHDHSGGGGGGGVFRRKVEFEWIYIALRGGGFPSINLQHELDKIANFRELDTRKAVVRLGHLQSPASYVWDDLDCSQFEMIEERGHVGCGYIPEDLLKELVGECKSKKIAQNSLGIQVRIVGPKIGLFKGMLFRKKNISKIQLPTSMLKVSPTTSTENVVGFDNQNWVYMLATQQGIFPSENLRSLGQKLEAEKRNEPLPQGDKRKRNHRGKKILSDMIVRLWLGLGVPEYAVDRYIEEVKRTDFPKHAWPVGVVDPTGFIPSGHIFVTGLSSLKEGTHQRLQSIFITRSPCVNPDDVQMLPLLTKRPPKMPFATWKWLNQLPFGAVIFPLCQSPNETPLPETIAAGDLDGDLYFSCWDTKILSYLLTADKGERWGNIELFDVVVKGEEEVGVNWKETGGIVEIISDDEDDECWMHRSTKTKGESSIKYEFSQSNDDCDSVIDISSDDDDDSVLCLSNYYGSGASEASKEGGRIQILAHREQECGTYEVEVLWQSGKKTWEPLPMMKYKFPNHVSDYARKKKLTNDIEFYLTDSEDEDDDCLLEDGAWNSCELLGNDDWFQKAQKLMLHLPLMNDIGRLVGCLFQLNKIASENSTEGIHDEDAIAFGAAYKKSLELEKHFEKHGGRVYLPKHLHDQVKPKQALHKFLTSCK